MLEKLKRDNFFLGVILGIVVPVIVFTIVYFTDRYLSETRMVPTVIKDSTKYLIGVFFNLILFRIYMVNWKMDKTGRGLLAITFFLAIGYLLLFHLLNKHYLFQ